jgi:hypothetical protein
MKQLKILTASFLALLLLAFSQCKKKTEEPQLPPETTTGAMTFGCKVNGQVFVPKDGRGRPGLYVQYVNLGAGVGGGWYLNIPATNWVPSTPEGVNIETDSLLVVEGMTYSFKNQKGSPRAFYDKGVSYVALDNDGILKITKFDQSNRILSGTFSFIGTNTTNGEKLNITEGRFDIRY